MLKLSGTLTIRSITGRNGAFNVGRLATELGDFAVKDTLLDQYDEGRYEGEFGITRIYPSHYLAGARLVVEVRATLATMALAGIDPLPERDTLQAGTVEPDPMEETQPTAAIGPKGETSQGEPHEKYDGEPVAGDPDAILFSMLWPLGEAVKLDPTVDRSVFRRQRDRLKELGYRFQPLGQAWTRSTTPESIEA